MQKAQQLIGSMHVADPSVPGRVFNAVAKAGEEHDYGQGWIGRMAGQRNKTGKTAERTENCDTTLAECVVDVRWMSAPLPPYSLCALDLRLLSKAARR